MTDAATNIDPSPSPGAPEPEDRQPPRRAIGGSSAGWLLLAAAGLFFLILAAALWYALAPVSLARLVGRLADRPLDIEGLTLAVERRPLSIPPGGVLVVTPRQKIALGPLVTNRWLNYDLSLTSPDFDLAGVTGGQAAAPVNFMDLSVFQPTSVLRLEALDNGLYAAEFKILVQYEAQDYAAWAALAQDPLQKMELYRKVLELDPKYPGALDELAAVLAATGQPEQAAAIYEAILGNLSDEAEGEALARLLELYAGIGQRDGQSATIKRLVDWNRNQGRPVTQALRRIRQIYRERPGQSGEMLKALLPDAPHGEAAEILGELALLSRRQGDTRGEIEALKKLVDLAPERAREIWTGLLALYETAGDDSGRLDALKSLAAILPDGSEKASIHRAIGLASVEAGDYGTAAAAYRAALALEPEDAPTLLNLARVQGLSGRRGEYRGGLEKLAARFPDNLEFLEELVGALREDGLWAQAQKQCRILVEARPGDLETRLTLMELMEKNKDQDGLREQYAILIALRPDDQVALYNYGALLFDRKELDEAALVFQKLLDLNAGEEAAREYLLAIYQRQGQDAEVLEQALALYRLNPSKVVYRAFILNTYENAKDWARFAAAAAEFAALSEDDPEGWRLLARGQANLNRKKEAAHSLWRAAEAARSHAESWIAAGAAYAELGELGRGREAYQKALDLEPGSAKATRALMELDRRSADGQDQDQEGG